MNFRAKIINVVFFGIAVFEGVFSQNASLSGTITNEKGELIQGASIILKDKNFGGVSNQKGAFSITIPAKEKIYITCSFLGYQQINDSVYAQPLENVLRNYILIEESRQLGEVIVESVKDRENTLSRVNMKSIDQLPNTSGNIETLLKSFSNVVSGNELSSQYSVRGGNYDENLIYVNDIEIYRPMLVQSAQQEGLSFVNPDMVSTIQFSAGGFEAMYGDKMSSVLDITYKKPVKLECSASASLLGTNLHVAGISKNHKLSFNTGFRYKTSQYVLSSLDVKGEYIPRFVDIQTFLTYELSAKSSISLLGNYSTNRFVMIPETRSTSFGSIMQTLSFDVFYEGQEKDRFDSYMGAVSYNYTPARNLILKFIASTFNSDEEITYDILSEYYINSVSKGSGNDTTINIGTGASLEHARNYLNSRIHAFEHKGIFLYGNNSNIRWGIKAQLEYVDDAMKEWSILDSTGYFLPNSDETIEMDYVISKKNKISPNRYQSFIQNFNRIYSDFAEFDLTYGVRISYWDYNKELIVSPRVSATIKPYWKKDVNFYIAAGLYNQPPFYKELKDYTGKLYTDIKSQKSLHLVAGSDIHYLAWNRPFTFTTELYYKDLYQLIPYKVDNVQVQYIPSFDAKGYAAGVDLRIYGEFVPGTESWFSLSLMQTREDSYNDEYKKPDGTVVNPGYYRRPTDQTITFSVFFQDYLPSNPDFKLHLLMNYGSGLPYSGPTPNRPSEVYMLNQYRRVDIGCSRVIQFKKNPSFGLKDVWITFEVLNLFGNENMASFDWIKTVANNEGFRDQYAVPNYLTGRRFNIKISTKLSK